MDGQGDHRQGEAIEQQGRQQRIFMQVLTKASISGQVKMNSV